ncbi:MAG: HAMP domain-containing histidine kinase, partial [Anaerolineae bacterium]|nr:HAMP domain-containing histidine kinase [Anaerolineae bacterium]
TLIDDLLDLAAVKTGLRVTGETEPVDLQVVLTRIVERHRVPAAEKGIDLQVQISDSHPICVAATTEELDRAFTNLVSNAVKYTPEGGLVEITLGAQAGKAQLVVRDSGIGVPAEALPHLFEEFYRAPNAKAQVKQGTGLGLVITKDIVTRYGGTIRVSSTEGEGTTVTVILPTIAASADEATSDVTTDTPQNTRVMDSGITPRNSRMEESCGDKEDSDC